MVETKQIKVDNWGIFFLQRLQQFYNKSAHCDLTLLFDDHVRIKVHRLVLNACTEYFSVIEKQCPIIENDCLRMPANLPSEIVIPIINFMYSGILELNESSFDRLYSTAKLMNMSVLLKLLDAQKTPIKPQKRIHATPISWHTPKKIITKTPFNEDTGNLPETLPGRKLPIWRRKSLPTTLPYISSSNYESFTPKKFQSDEPPKPTRFDWPDEENSFDNAFDDISYESKPLILPTFTEKVDTPKAGPSCTFEEIKKTAVPVKRSASPIIGNQCKKVNLQDVKEYLKEHKIRSDYIEYEDSEAADNDLQTFESNNEDSNDEFIKNETNDDTPNKSILKNEAGPTPSNKHVRFSLEGDESDPKGTNKHVRFSLEEEEAEKKIKTVGKGGNVVAKGEQQDMTKHTKIIAEVLKKYPHLVKNNKNIRLKILAKGNGTPKTAVGKTNAPKQTSKVSYMVMKPDEKSKTQSDKEHVCTRCENPQTFQNYHTYRQHLTDVHNEKQDSQLCMICGYVCRKQNMLVYHKFVKHNIQPPAMYTFPKCSECPYIAISPVVLQKHMNTHTQTNQEDKIEYVCKHCDKKFTSENLYNNHIQRCEQNQEKVEENISPQKTTGKEKIKILSDVKVSGAISTQKHQKEVKVEVPISTEPSSEAEALSNVASGIAASLGLVDTIVVLDENQFINLQSQQQNIINSDGQEYIIPEMHLDNIATSNTVTQITQPTVTLSSDANAVLAQSLQKTGITSTDELVMVLTDHDYGDGNNAVITDNNIVVLYSHPVQTQAGTMMLTSEGNMIEVDKNYAQNIPVTIAQGSCEESIEMIQQEINNQLDTQENPPQQNYEEQKEEISAQPEEISKIDNVILENEMAQEEPMESEPIENYEEANHTELIENQQEEIANLESNVEENVEAQQENVNNEEVSTQMEETQLEEPQQQQPIEENVTYEEIKTEDNSQMSMSMFQVEENMEQLHNPSEVPQENMEQLHNASEVVLQENLEQVVPQNEEYTEIEENIQMDDKTDQNEDYQVMEDKVEEEIEGEIVHQSEENQHQQEQNLKETAANQEATETLVEETIQTVEENVPLEENVNQQDQICDEEAAISEAPLLETVETQEETMEVNENQSEIIPNEDIHNEEIPITENVEMVPEDSQIEENRMEQDSQIEEEMNYQIEENVVPYEERLMPIEESMEQIGDIPQVEENLHHHDQPNVVSFEENGTTFEQTENKTTTETESNEETVEENDSNQKIEDVLLITPNEEEEKMEVEDQVQEKPTPENQNEDNNKSAEDKVESPTESLNKVDEKVESSNHNVANKEDGNTDGKNRIMKILDDWDDGDTDSQQSDSKVAPQVAQEVINQDVPPTNSIKKLIDDWEEDED